MKLLLHTCCAPCTAGVLGALESEPLDVTFYWYNPNIHPYMEYKTRRDSLFSLAEESRHAVIEHDEYGLRKFITNTANDIPHRCGYCYEERFDAVARAAAENNFDEFSTTLLVSPYQNHDLIVDICVEKALKYGVAFFYRDFRPEFREGQKKAREMGVYMQKYCGCIFSEEERYKQNL